MMTAQKALALPLVGLVTAWGLFMVATYSDLFVQPIFDDSGVWLSEGSTVRASTYLVLTGIAVFAILSLLSLRGSTKLRGDSGVTDSLTTAVYRFARLGVIVGLGAAVIFGVSAFLGAFTRFGAEEPLVSRLFGVYIPIVLAALLIVVIVMVAFVFRSDQTSDADNTKRGLSDRQKALGLGYATPILAAATAVIFGLIVYDVTRTTLEAWVWVVIQVIIAAGIILGTRYARLARAEAPAAPKPRTAIASGAWNLNFVLSIVFGAVVSVMAFTLGAQAIEELRDYNFDFAGWSVKDVSLEWFLSDFSPALVLIVLVSIGLYATITERHKTPDPAS